MNWDEQLIAENEALGGVTDTRMDHALAGAHWMRRQLRTDEAVERVARGIAQAHGLTPELWHQYEGVARAAITALIGEEL